VRIEVGIHSDDQLSAIGNASVRSWNGGTGLEGNPAAIL